MSLTPTKLGTPIERDTSICGAKKRDGTPCRKPPMANGRCRLHGGLTPTGFGLPQTTHGRYSKHLPKHLVQDYEEALSDERLLDLSENIALTDTRLSNLLRNLNDAESLQSWSELGSVLGPLQKSILDGDTEKAEGYVKQLFVAWQAIYEDAEIWKEIFEVTELRRKLVESEKKRLVDMDLMIAADKAYLLISFIQDIILRHVTDASVRTAIAYELRTVLDKSTGERSGSTATE